MTRILLICAFNFLLCISTFSQSLVSFSEKSSIAEIFIELALGINVDSGTKSYKIVYTTTSVEGTTSNASGLLIIPDEITGPLPELIYQHGTVNGREIVPSREMGGYELGLGFAAFSYIVYAPDYEGLGDSPGVHPYINARSEAQAAIDMYLASQEFLSQQGLESNGQLFITGYSQGGHAAMAAHKFIQQDYPNIQVTASAPMSGPYDVSNTMVNFTLGDEEYLKVSYLPWTILGQLRAYGNSILAGYTVQQIFKSDYVADILDFANENILLSDMNTKLSAKLQQIEGEIKPKFLFQDSVRTAVLANPQHPLNLALKENDVYNWIPQVPVRMMYCLADEQVAARNAIFTDSLMNADGAQNVSSLNLGDNLDHGDCVIPASLATKDFFEQFANRTTSTVSHLAANTYFKIAPNPANDYITISSKDGRQIKHISWYNPTGILMQRYNSINSNSTDMNVESLPAGIYLLQIIDSKHTYNSKIIIGK